MRWTAREAIRDWTQQKGQGPRPDFPIENPLAQQGGVGPPAAPTIAASRRSRLARHQLQPGPAFAASPRGIRSPASGARSPVQSCNRTLGA